MASLQTVSVSSRAASYQIKVKCAIPHEECYVCLTSLGREPLGG